jgi:gas vesicle protein
MAKEVGKEAGMSAASGATAGATLGTAIMPGWGTAIGAAIGAVVGGIAGAFSGSSKKKAKRYQKLAAKVQQEREANRDYEQFLQMIRQQRIARATTMSQAVSLGIEESTALQGAVSGQQSQTAHGINYLAEDRRLQELYNSYMKSAGKAASIAQDQSTAFNTLNNLVMAAGNTMMKGNATSTTTTTNTQTTSQPGVTGTFSMNPVINY